MSEQTDQTTEQDVESTEDTEQETTEEEEGDTFPRAVVEKLRREAADSRVRAKRADDLADALWTARVAATGRLADPTDLTMPADADPLDTDAITAAVDELLARKPHLASRRPVGTIGQGATASATNVDLAGMLRSRA